MIEDIAEAVVCASCWRSEGKQVVFTNGCFDLFHVGHLHTLRTAASVGDKLIVGVNSDESVRKLKGDERPIIPQQQRAEIVAAISGVDIVVVFNEETPLELVRALRPHIIVKCETWAHNVVGKDDAGIVILSEQLPGISTTEIITRIMGSVPHG